MKTRSQSALSFDPKAYLAFKCPLCGEALERRKITTAATYVKGFLGALLAPLLVGFYLIHNALRTRPEVYACPSCGRTT
jgi:predicted RNA-binding Zn-ribbon protein involved in translation (DUF1610 family)